MSSLNLSNVTSSTLNWNISGLASAFNTTNYMMAALAGSGVTDGQSTASYYSSVSAPSSGTSTTTPTGSDSGYTPSSTVTLYGIIQAANGLWYNAGSATVTFLAPPLPSAPTLNSVSGSSTSFSANWTNGANTTYCKVWLQGVGTYTAGAGATSLTTSVSLSPATYFVQIIPENAQGEGTYSNTLSFVVTVPPPSGLTGLSATGNNGYVHLAWNASSGATNYNISWSGGSSGSASTSSTTSDVMGLSNGTSYTFTVTPTNSGGSGSSQSVSATPGIRPANFNWSPALSTGTAPPTASQWNLFTAKIDAFRLYKGYATYGFSTAPVGKFYAWQFNQAVNGLNTISGSMTNNLMPPIRSSGQTLYASELNNFVTSLNSIP